MNLKCNQKNHQKDDKVAVCLKDNCQSNRLLCWRCLTQFHSDHVQYAISLSDLAINNVENWPLDEALKTIHNEFTSSSSDQIVSKLESLFEVFSAKFLKELEMIKKQIISQIKNMENNGDLIAKLKTAMEKAISLTSIQEIIREMKIENFDEKEREINDKINFFLSNQNEGREKAINDSKNLFHKWTNEYQCILEENRFNEITINILKSLNQFEEIFHKKCPNKIRGIFDVFLLLEKEEILREFLYK